MQFLNKPLEQIHIGWSAAIVCELLFLFTQSHTLEYNIY